MPIMTIDKPIEISETNDSLINKHYNLNEDSYTIRGSKPAGIWILKECEKFEEKSFEPSLNNFLEKEFTKDNNKVYLNKPIEKENQ
jgi:hypothetical protein